MEAAHHRTPPPVIASVFREARPLRPAAGGAIHSLETVSLRKEYPGTVALGSVSLRCAGGRVRALLGKNGAGKSTLVALLGGAQQPSAGRILIDGAPVAFRTPAEAIARGIATVHQELTIIPDLSVGENILLGRLPRRGPGLIDWGETFRRAASHIDELGLSLDVRAEAGKLPVAGQQMVEIARAMSRAPSVLMLDEPTSALPLRETETLFALLRRLAATGVVILYITHRLGEIERIADDVTVLRNGEVAGTLPVQEATPAAIASMMYGELASGAHRAPLHPPGDPVMQVSGFTRRGAYQGVSFTLRRGEILGIGGVLGAGRTELLRGLFGADPHDAGTVTVGGTTVHPSSPAQMKRLGVVLAPEDRKREGLVRTLSTAVNVNLARYWPAAFPYVATARRDAAVAGRFVREFGIAVPGLDAPVAALSGGNQQKVVIAKWLATGPRVLLLDEPTRGIDIAAKRQVYDTVRRLCAGGLSAVVVSSELEELLDVCHRIIVLRGGSLCGEVLPEETTIKGLLGLCMA